MVIPKQMNVTIVFEVVGLLEKNLEINPDTTGVMVSGIWVRIRKLVHFWCNCSSYTKLFECHVVDPGQLCRVKIFHGQFFPITNCNEVRKQDASTAHISATKSGTAFMVTTTINF